MITIGIMGGIGHGKTSFAEALQSIESESIFLESSALIAEIINDWQAITPAPPDPGDLKALNSWLALLPDILKKSLHADVGTEQLLLTNHAAAENPALYQKLFDYLESVKVNPDLARTPITKSNKDDYRPILQWLGAFVQHTLNPGIWFQELRRQAKNADLHRCKLAVFSGVRFQADVDVLRDYGGYIVEICRPSIAEIDTDDLTEQARFQIKPDCTIVNDGKLDDLVLCARILLSDADKGRVSERYIVSDIAAHSATIKQIRS